MIHLYQATIIGSISHRPSHVTLEDPMAHLHLTRFSTKREERTMIWAPIGRVEMADRHPTVDLLV
jgi:hypothetical protein